MTVPKIIQEVLNRVSFEDDQTLTNNQKAQARTNIGVPDDADVVKLSGTQTIAGDKDFSGELTAVTPDEDDNSTKVATTEFVMSAVNTIINSITLVNYDEVKF
jgi:hypothetical protein